MTFSILSCRRALPVASLTFLVAAISSAFAQDAFEQALVTVEQPGLTESNKTYDGGLDYEHVVQVRDGAWYIGTDVNIRSEYYSDSLVGIGLVGVGADYVVFGGSEGNMARIDMEGNHAYGIVLNNMFGDTRDSEIRNTIVNITPAGTGVYAYGFTTKLLVDNVEINMLNTMGESGVAFDVDSGATVTNIDGGTPRGPVVITMSGNSSGSAIFANNGSTVHFDDARMNLKTETAVVSHGSSVTLSNSSIAVESPRNQIILNGSYGSSETSVVTLSNVDLSQAEGSCIFGNGRSQNDKVILSDGTYFIGYADTDTFSDEGWHNITLDDATWTLTERSRLGQGMLVTGNDSVVQMFIISDVRFSDIIAGGFDMEEGTTVNFNVTDYRGPDNYSWLMCDGDTYNIDENITINFIGNDDPDLIWDDSLFRTTGVIRVYTIPEPVSASLALLGLATVAWRRKSR